MTARDAYLSGGGLMDILLADAKDHKRPEAQTPGLSGYRLQLKAILDGPEEEREPAIHGLMEQFWHDTKTHLELSDSEEEEEQAASTARQETSLHSISHSLEAILFELSAIRKSWEMAFGRVLEEAKTKGQMPDFIPGYLQEWFFGQIKLAELQRQAVAQQMGNRVIVPR